MRPIFIIALFTLSVRAYAQTEQKVYKLTEYINGGLYRELYDTAKSHTGIADIYFFKEHFNIPYDLPDKFINKPYKNKTITVWTKSKSRKDHKADWKNAYKYDRLGRLTNYAYSSCFICNSLPYEYEVIYNLKGQIQQIEDFAN
jgi:hypothetical protein